MATNKINTFNLIEDTSKINQTNFNYSTLHSSKISQFVKPIFTKIKDLSSKHLGSPTYLLVNQEDMVSKKIAKIFSWVFGISLTILLVAYVYDRLVDFYHQHFENYSRMEEYPDEFSENLDPLILLPENQPVIIEHFPEQIIPKTLEPSSSINDDISDTTAQTDVDGDFKPVSEEEITANFSNVPSQTIPKIEVKDYPEENQEHDTQMDLDSKNQEFTESRSSSDDVSNATTDSLEDSFEKIDITPELLKEMKNSPEMPSPSRGVGLRILQIAKGIKAFWANNPFTSNKPNKTYTISSETEPKKPSYEDLKMLHPIIEAYENRKIYTIAENIEQIKVDIPRMKLFANGIHCANIQDFMNGLGLTLNEDETDISPRDNAIIPKILDLSQQNVLNFSHSVLTKHWQNLNVMPMMARIEGIRSTVHVKWNAEFPEQCEITGEALFHILSLTDSTFLPYLCKLKIKHFLDKAEISWEILEDSSFETAATFQATEELEPPKPASAEFDDENFEIFEGNEDISNVDYNWNIAFDHLLNKPDICLNSTVTSEYLKSLKTKHSTFVYEDQLMFPVTITTDKIVNSLNKLKNNNPTNQTIFLPFLVKGWTVDHAVVAVINLADETIEYFDPKGQSSIGITRAEKQSNKNVFDFLTELGQKFISPTFSREKIVYNKKNTPQKLSDNINCGAFCLQFIEKRITRPFNDIENDLSTDPKELRLELARRLGKNIHSNSI